LSLCLKVGKDMKKAILILTILLFIITIAAQNLEAYSMEVDQKQEFNEMFEGQLEEIELSGLDKLLKDVDPELQELFFQGDLKKFIRDLINRGLKFDFIGIIKIFCQYFFQETILQFYLLSRLLLLAVLSAVLHTFEKAFNQSRIAKISHNVICLVLSLMALTSFKEAINIGRNAVADITGFMHSLIPVLMSLLVAVGGFTSSAIFQPLIFLFINLVGAVINNIFFPGLYLAAVLLLIGHMVEDFNISRLAALVKNVNIAILSFSFTAFLGIMVIQGVIGSVSDGVSIRAVKFLSKTFVPIIGGMVAEAMDVIVSSSLLIKNGLGVIGVIIMFMIVSVPIIKILSFVLIYKLASAFIQPVCDKRIVDCLNEMGNILIMVLAALIVVSLMFFITITILIGVGNVTVMLR